MKKGALILIIIVISGLQISLQMKAHPTLLPHTFGYTGIPPSPSAPDEVLINELETMPPSGQGEWLELFNPGSLSLDLSPCSVHDANAQIHQFSSGDTVSPGGHFVVNLSSQKLNNSGDTVQLICSGLLIDEVRYGSHSPAHSYYSEEGFEESLGYLPDPSGLNTLGRSPDGNSLWFLFSHELYPTKGSANSDLRVVQGVINPSFGVSGTSVRISWEYPEGEDMAGTKIFVNHSGTGYSDQLVQTVAYPEQTALIENLPQELITIRLISFDHSGKEAEGVRVAELAISLIGLEVSEVLPYPKVGLEFIELHNSSPVPLDLTDYELNVTNASADLNDPSGSFIFSAFILAPDEYFAISIDPESYGFRLSDIGSLIEIFDENGIPIASIDYLTPFKGVSVTYDDQILTTLQHPTPNRPNIFANLSPTALISLQGSPRITGCTSLSFNPTGAQSFDPDEDDISYAWTYTNESGDILFTSAEKNPLSFPFTTDLGEYFTVELEATDPFGEMGTDILKLELLICDGRKQTLKEIQSEGVGGVVQYSSDILINELLPNPYGKDTGVEFIELYNRGPESVQLNGWKLGEKTKKKLDGLSIASKGFLIFEKASLLNSKATVELLDPHDDVISSVTYTDAEEGRSYSRDEYDNFRWTAPTPGSLNDFPFEKESVYLQASAPVIITRFLANPKGPDEGQEWIEIQNRTESPVDLTGWQLDDREGASVPYTFPSLILRPKQTLKLSSDTSGITLRNTADQIRLFNDMRQLIDQVEWFTPVADGLILTRSDLVQGENIEPDLAKVIRVVDGDTIDVEMTVDGILKVERVRLIGVDTPETVHPFKPLEFFGKEASNYTKSQLEGQTVRLEYDLSKRDKYGRLLAYIYLGDRHFNAELISKGYAFAYLRFPFRYREEFRRLEIQAKEAGVGIWASDDIVQIKSEQQKGIDEELEGMEIFEEMLKELEEEKEEDQDKDDKDDKEEEMQGEKNPEDYDQMGWDQIRLNEILPNPAGKDNEGGEFIELINLGTVQVDLSDWEILNNKKKAIYGFNNTVVAEDGDVSTVVEDRHLRLWKGSIFLLQPLLTALKNTSETIQLIDPFGTVRDEFSYDQAMKDDQVWARNPLTGAWQLSKVATPDAANPFTLISSGPDSDHDGISDEDELSLGFNPLSWDGDANGFPDDFELMMMRKEVEFTRWQDLYHYYLDTAFSVQLKQTARTLTFSGTSRPYTTIQLTIYSTPQTVFIPVEPDGNWKYKVDVGLEKGSHHAEVYSLDPNGVMTSSRDPLLFTLETRMNVAKLAKISHKKTKKPKNPKGPKVKPLYQIMEPTPRFTESQVLAWNPQIELLSLSNGQNIQLAYSKQLLADQLLTPGQTVRYSLKEGGIVVKDFELVPRAYAKESSGSARDDEPLVVLFCLGAILLVGIIVSKRIRRGKVL